MKPSTPKRTCEDGNDEQRQPIGAENLRRIRKIRKDNGGTAPSEERCGGPEELPKDDKAEKIRLTASR